MHCLTLSGAMPWQRVTAAAGRAPRAMINDTGIQVHQKYPDRFVVGVELPILDPELALKELNRVAGSLACARCICRTPSNGATTYSIHDLRRCWRALRH